ncbi:MAG: hypothetical protein H0W15_09710 [Gemmatimonadales bacterium]|nr:hypothetical protein [Gemmatimonadales bacterium]
MPLTTFQRAVLKVLSAYQDAKSGYLAGGAALHFAPDSLRYSRDLDFFHDSVERVADAFAADRGRLEAAGCTVEVTISQPGFVRAVVRRGADATLIDWAHESAWRFMPLVRIEEGGFLLHPVDLAVSKLLALVGRNEPRDFVDVLYVHAHVLPLGALCWAAVGKDPGFSPRSLLEMLKRRGQYRSEDFARLDLVVPIDLIATKESWRAALDAAEGFILTAPPEQIGCLYWSTASQHFLMPSPDLATASDVVPHFGRPGGVLPNLVDANEPE